MKALLYISLTLALPLPPIVWAQDAPNTSPEATSTSDVLGTPEAKHTFDKGLLYHKADRADELAKDETALQGLISIKEIDTTEKGRTFLTALTGDEEWLEGFLYSGPMANLNMALNYLYQLVEMDPEILTNPKLKQIATTTALEFARNKWPFNVAKERYTYYSTSWKDGKLNAIFDKLGYMEMRLLTGCKIINWGEAKNLAWFRDNVRLPAESYPGSCWQAPYRLNNIVGDSIHGRDYYRFFNKFFDGKIGVITRDVGGVCGSLSHFGCFAAIGNGVPAMTMGEPGHCAFTVRTTATTWTPAYSLTWERGCHWTLTDDHSWAFLIITQKMMENPKKTAEALRLAALARAQEDKTTPALKFYGQAIDLQPHNHLIWADALDYARQHKADDAEVWRGLYSKLLKSFAKDYPDVAWTYSQKLIFPNLFKKIDDKGKTALYKQFWDSVNTMTPLRWRVETALSDQKKSLSDTASVQEHFRAMLVDSLSSKGDYIPIAIAWGTKELEKQPEELSKFVRSVAGKVSKSTGGGMDKKAKHQLFGQILISAEQNKDRVTFQGVGQLMKDEFKPSLPKYDPFPGQLLSTSGLIRFSSVSGRFGDPTQHWGLLETVGGHFHTNEDDPAWLEVELPKLGDISGIVIIVTDNNHARLHNMKVEVSQDGNQWEEVFQFGQCNNRIMRSDLGGKNPRAKYIRITRPGKGFFHLNGVHIYGKPAS